MRKIILAWMLVFFSVGISTAQAIPHKRLHKEPTIQLIPYIQTAPRITKEDHEICARRARVGAQAFLNAKKHSVPEDEQLKEWDRFSLSQDAEGIDINELVFIRKIIQLAYKALAKYPQATYIDYGDFIYGSCVQEKSAVLVHF